VNTARSAPVSGIIAALSTPFFLGLAPIFGQIAINAGADPFGVAALRTIIAVALLWLVYALFFRRFIFIYPAGLMGCVVIGVVNGIGSLFYYGGLSMLDASLAQLVNGMYLALAVLLALVAGQKAEMRTLVRVGLALAALVLLTGFGHSPIRWEGIGLMLGSALMFAGTMILSQYVLYEMPSRTVTLYVLTTMGVVVTVVWLTVGSGLTAVSLESTLPPIIILGVTTALSRLAMFAGVKFLGGMQTAILALAEIGVALFLAFLLLDESLSAGQWVGVGLLMLCLLLIRQRDLLPRGFNPNAILVANMASVQFQRIAFHRAFGTHDHDNEAGTMGAITTQEILAIQRMMGAQTGGVDPFPIGKSQQLLEQIYEAGRIHAGAPLPPSSDARGEGRAPASPRN
jgi:drug/metabolite transporter (DMT)-like permease